ncbi:MAG: UbiA family prenyltransferase, partial [Planctomycetes bacterium]|nr:UbiA family prenyltransferase [Planctomycetota bacterium]
AYIFNDVCDVEIDMINSPSRVLPQGIMRRKTALAWSMIFFVAGLVLAGLCNKTFLIGMGVLVLLMLFYNMFSKRIGLLKDSLVAFLVISIYPLTLALTEAVQTPRLKSLYIFPIWLFLSTLGYEMLKDIRDIKGDRQSHGKSIAEYSGKKWFLRLARFIAVVAGVVSILPFVLGYCKQIYLAASIIAILLAVLSTRKEPSIAIRYIYLEVFLITAGSAVDLMVYGP